MPRPRRRGDGIGLLIGADEAVVLSSQSLDLIVSAQSVDPLLVAPVHGLHGLHLDPQGLSALALFQPVSKRHHPERQSGGSGGNGHQN